MNARELYFRKTTPEEKDASKQRRMARDEEVRDISVEVYKLRLESSRQGAVARMLKDDADDGVKLRERAESYDPLTRSYLAVLAHRLDRAQ